MKIGLTGSIACGKSTVSAYLRSLGFFVADADAISHALTAPGGSALPLLREAFGDGVFDGEILSRARLGSLVFGDPAQRERLNAILHPLIIGELQAQLCKADTGGAPVFGDVPLLYECGMQDMFDQIWVMCVPRDVQLARIVERDGLSEADAARRIDAQMPLARKCAMADAVISTDGTIEETQRQVLALLRDTAQRRQP
ncbi:MAG: dephospho-CoA kinase [Clostridia bacterium]|nr:dephospho-CoA kinase [Clostridia bacterium]